jgi:chemotaxis protein MotB
MSDENRAHPRRTTRGRPVPRDARARALGAALALALVGGSSAGCVRKETHQRTLEELERVREGEARVVAELGKARGEIAKLAAAMDERDAATIEADGARADLTSKLGSAEEHNAELGARLEAASRTLDAMRGKNGELSVELTALRARVDALKAAQVAAEARAAQQRAILEGFRSMIDAGDLAVEVEGGRVLLVLENDVLFDAGQASVRKEGKRVLRDVAQRLAAMRELELQVGGHTDDTPIKTDRFPSNWELSTARAVEVVQLLVATGIDPRRLSAAGYGEHRPAGPNDGDDGRARNRRIEIALVPDLAPVLEEPAAPTGGDQASSATADEGCSG